ncbi:hypothetical protein [Sediminitomix flava]|nr:hypothetical protein [Sediminitomix flava]
MCILPFFATAQEDTGIEVSQVEEKIQEGAFSKFAIGFSGGTTGAGFDISTNLTKHLQLSVEGNLFQLMNIQHEADIEGEPFTIDASVDLQAFDAKIAFLPFAGSSFKLVGGFGYFKNDVTIVGIYEEDVALGEINVDPGQLTVRSTWKVTAPYMGIGFGRPVPKRRIGFGLDMGAYYVGSPDARLTGTNLVEAMNSQEEQLRENLSGYEWFPVIKFRLAVRLN